MAATAAALVVSLVAALALVHSPRRAAHADSAPRGGRPVSLADANHVIAHRRLSLTGVRLVRLALPTGAWAVSFDVRLTPATRLQLALGPDSPPLTLDQVGAIGVFAVGGRSYVLPDRAGWSPGGWRHIELTGDARPAQAAPGTATRLLIDGRALALASGSGHGSGPTLTLRLVRGSADARAIILTPARAGVGLLLHRLAELHARVAPGGFPAGADLADRLHFSAGWTSGFWAGALWQAATLAPADGLFEHWALAATIAHFGQERADTHDVGFMYGESSLAAWNVLCSSAGGPQRLCARLRRSVLSAADQLRTLAAANARAGTIPTDGHSRPPTTIVDSMMNLRILTWAGAVTGDAAYTRLAARHAHALAALLVRRDGSTAQAVEFDAATGRALHVGTHQGLSDSSTWARGQGWAIYGFAQTAAALHDPTLLAVARRAAGYVARKLPRGSVPRWDYDAASGPRDVSAAVITAAGLVHLADACRRLLGACPAAAGWVSLARRMLAAALRYAAERPAIGLLRSQVLNHRNAGSWDDHAELMFGLTYALEASADLVRGVATDA